MIKILNTYGFKLVIMSTSDWFAHIFDFILLNPKKIRTKKEMEYL